ncbi:hypothetical protein WG66_014546 [Moniliophthora roreri]|nr:hypothetical protein WG66_014546 [Moniliophthora roreri]
MTVNPRALHDSDQHNPIHHTQKATYPACLLEKRVPAAQNAKVDAMALGGLELVTTTSGYLKDQQPRYVLPPPHLKIPILQLLVEWGHIVVESLYRLKLEDADLGPARPYPKRKLSRLQVQYWLSRKPRLGDPPIHKSLQTYNPTYLQVTRRFRNDVCLNSCGIGAQFALQRLRPYLRCYNMNGSTLSILRKYFVLARNLVQDLSSFCESDRMQSRFIVEAVYGILELDSLPFVTSSRGSACVSSAAGLASHCGKAKAFYSSVINCEHEDALTGR